MSSTPEPGTLYWGKIVPICDSISIYDGPEEFLRQHHAVPRDLGLLFAAHWCQSEVRNGGFLQFFFNDTGVLAPEAAEAFRAIGLVDCAELMERAMAHLGSEYPRERDKRLEILGMSLAGDWPAESPFDALDDKFFELLPWQEDRFEIAADNYARLRLS